MSETRSHSLQLYFLTISVCMRTVLGLVTVSGDSVGGVSFTFFFRHPLVICFRGWFTQHRFEKPSFKTN